MCRDWHKAKTADPLTVGFIKYLERKIYRYLCKYTLFIRTLSLSTSTPLNNDYWKMENSLVIPYPFSPPFV